MRPLNRKLLRDLRRVWGQVLAIAGVIAAAVATVVMSLGTLYSLEETRAAFYERYRFAEVFAHAERAPRSLAQRIAEIPGVQTVETRISEQVILDIAGLLEPARARMTSVPDGRPPLLNDLVMRTGRWIDPDRPDEVMITEPFAEANRFRPGDRITATINGRRRTLDIVGVVLSPEHIYSITPGEIVPDNRRYGIVYMSREALEAAFGMEGAFNDLTLTLTRGAVAADVIDRLDDLLEPYGGVGAYARDEHVSHAFLQSELDQLRSLTGIVPPIFLIVAAFLLNMVTERLIRTEREQIGLLKAFGYSSGAVGWHYLKFVLAIVAVGVAIGWAGGAWMGRGMTGLYAANYNFPFLVYILNPWVFAGAALVAALAAVLGALKAIRGAVALSPAVAMTPPPPTNYGGGWIERLVAVEALGASARMVLRHILRWPWRSAMTTTGISFAVALLVVSFFFMDSVDAMLDRFFFDNQRQDVTVTFTHPRPEAARVTLDQLPGVLRAELFRSVPVRLSVGPVSERTSITGREPGAELSRLLDAKGRPVALPSSGLVLTDALAEKLGVGPGERVFVEALEGRRSSAFVPVSLVVNELVGMSAYMDRRALSRFMLEAPTASGAHLAVDAAAMPAFYDAVTDMPAIQGVSAIGASLGVFKDLVESTIVTMTAFYVLFGSVIAIGVVYNAARISLSERGRELASLRVLGFGKGEVASILLGELAVFTLLALPIGCLLGFAVAALMVDLFSSELFRLPLVIERSTYGLACLVVLAAAVGTGIAVARRVAELDLVEVLKTRE